jgi:hypothetical protein
MKYVLDASVAVKWVIAEPDSAIALRLRDSARAGQDELIAPEFFLVECGHAFFRLARRKLLSGPDANRCLVAILADCPSLFPFLGLVPRALHPLPVSQHRLLRCSLHCPRGAGGLPTRNR